MRQAMMGLLLLMAAKCMATDKNDREFMRLVNITPDVATPGYVTSLIGNPEKVEESKKRTTWFYTDGGRNLTISWSHKSSSFEKFSFQSVTQTLPSFDNNLQLQLKSGSTDLAQALRILGVPSDMTIRNKTQEIHYTYQQKVLRLFFRDRVLVDFCLY